MPSFAVARNLCIDTNVRRQGTEPGEWKKTIATVFYEAKVTVDGIPTTLHLWDTAGQKEFNNIVLKKLDEKGVRVGNPQP